MDKTAGVRDSLINSLRAIGKHLTGVKPLSAEELERATIRAGFTKGTPDYDAYLQKLTQTSNDIATHTNAGLNAALPYAAGATGLGIGGGLAYQMAEDKPKKELDKVKKALVLQELQSPTGNPEEISKLSKEQQLFKLATSFNPSPAWKIPAIIGAGVAGLTLPAYLAFDWKRIRDRKREVAEQEVKLKQIKNQYDQKFLEEAKEALKVDPNAMDELVREMQKSSMEKASAGVHPWYTSDLIPLISTAALGTGFGTLGFMKGKKVAYQEGSRVPEIKMYRKSLENLTKMRPSGVMVKLPMKPEEQIAMELSRDTVTETPKPAEELKNTKGGTETPKTEPVVAEQSTVSAKVDDPELQKLLQSV